MAGIPVGVFFDTEIPPKVIVDFPFERPAAKIAAGRAHSHSGKACLPVLCGTG